MTRDRGEAEDELDLELRGLTEAELLLLLRSAPSPTLREALLVVLGGEERTC